MLSESELPLKLPPVDKYLPTESGEPPLARAENWKTKDGFPLETNTMPGFAGSSGYYLRYMDPTMMKSIFRNRPMSTGAALTFTSVAMSTVPATWFTPDFGINFCTTLDWHVKMSLLKR